MLIWLSIHVAPSVLRRRRPTLEPNDDTGGAKDEKSTREDEPTSGATSGLETDSRTVVNRREDSDESATEEKM